MAAIGDGLDLAWRDLEGRGASRAHLPNMAELDEVTYVALTKTPLITLMMALTRARDMRGRV